MGDTKNLTMAPPDESEREQAPSPLEKGMSQFFDDKFKEKSLQDEAQINEDKNDSNDAKIIDTETKESLLTEESAQDEELENDECIKDSADSPDAEKENEKDETKY